MCNNVERVLKRLTEGPRVGGLTIRDLEAIVDAVFVHTDVHKINLSALNLCLWEFAVRILEDVTGDYPIVSVVTIDYIPTLTWLQTHACRAIFDPHKICPPASRKDADYASAVKIAGKCQTCGMTFFLITLTTVFLRRSRSWRPNWQGWIITYL